MEPQMRAVRGIFIPQDRVDLEAAERLENDGYPTLVCIPPAYVVTNQYGNSGIVVGVSIGGGVSGYHYATFKVVDDRTFVVEDAARISDIGDCLECSMGDEKIAELLTKWGFHCTPEDIETHITCWIS